MSSKANLRERALAFRASLSDEEIRLRSRTAIEKLIQTVDWAAVQRMHVYPSRADWHEIDTTLILEYVRKHWTHIQIDQPEPRAASPVPQTQYDIVVVPVVAYDGHRHRLGAGSGWYDQFLAQQTHAMSIGLAYKETRLPLLPHEPHDIALTEIIAV